MSDDRRPPTAKDDRPAMKIVGDERAPTPPPDEVDPVLGISERDLNLLNAFYHHLALDASEDPSPPTAEEQAELDASRAHTDRLLAMTQEEMTAERARRRRRRER